MLNPVKLFIPVESMDVEAAKEFLRRHGLGTFQLLDVREPEEYRRAHIPGARHFSLTGLFDSYRDLHAERPTVVYCSTGTRSRIAAQILSVRGFRDLYHLKGGLAAWDGSTARDSGLPDVRLVQGDESPAEIVRIAYGMENTLGLFYRSVAGHSTEAQVVALARKLAAVEDRHREHLLDLADELGIARADLRDVPAAGTVEGGYDVNELIHARAESFSDVRELLDFAMVLETQALDLYVRLAHRLEEERSKKVFFSLADDEKAHLAALGALRDERG